MQPVQSAACGSAVKLGNEGVGMMVGKIIPSSVPDVVVVAAGGSVLVVVANLSTESQALQRAGHSTGIGSHVLQSHSTPSTPNMWYSRQL